MPTVSLWVCAGISICLAKLPFASQTIMHLVKTHAQSVQFNNGITLTGNTSDELWGKPEITARRSAQTFYTCCALHRDVE